jgi:hypothetical protein
MFPQVKLSGFIVQLRRNKNHKNNQKAPGLIEKPELN